MMLSLGQGGEIGWKLWSFRMLRVMMFFFFGGGHAAFRPSQAKGQKHAMCNVCLFFCVDSIIFRKFPLDCVSASI